VRIAEIEDPLALRGHGDSGGEASRQPCAVSAVIVRRLSVVAVRQARVEDAPAMGRVMVRAWLAAHRGQLPSSSGQRRRARWTPQVSAEAWERNLRERDASAEPARDCYLVAEDERATVVAVAMGSVNHTDPSGFFGEINVLYVDPDQHRRGIGRQLVQHLSACLADRGVTSVRVGVLTANHQARLFYEALGGQHLGERLLAEDGELLPESIYAWPDITSLLSPPDAEQGSGGCAAETAVAPA
jgi:ribosomal protein S18 acetylase RimI-like enzyme